MEGVSLAMVCLSPWAFGAVQPRYEFFLYAGVATLLTLWAIRTLLEWRFRWRKCPVVICLAALFLSGILQLLPLSEAALSRLSPATAAAYDLLLPAQPELLPFGEGAAAPQAGFTLSLYPEATRQWLLQVLGGLALFVVVRNNLASGAAFRRLSVVVLANGVALSLFGLIQFFSSRDPGTIYWSYPSAGAVFGPFVNRNHFAFYINLCIGMALGLLLQRTSDGRAEPGRLPAAPGDWVRADGQNRIGAPLSGFESRLWPQILGVCLRPLHDALALWISCGLALMLAATMFCASRGGFIALIGASATCLILGLKRAHRVWQARGLLLALALALALLIWFGTDQMAARWATLWTGKALGDDRVFLLTHAWPLIQDFPWWGTGNGTFQYVEPIRLHTPQDVGMAYVHAHNEYLEGAIEGGMIRLGLSLLAIGMVFRLGRRALQVHQQQRLSGLIFGALLGFTAVVIHSFVEFGIHIPAIAVLTTMVAAQLCGMADRPPGRSTDGQQLGGGIAPGEVSFGGLMPIIGAVAAVCLGWVLYSNSANLSESESLQRMARQERRAARDSGQRGTEIPYLQAAVGVTPQNAELQLKLAEAYFDLYQNYARKVELNHDEKETLIRRGLVPALRHALRARDLCPLLPVPHVRIAAYVEQLQHADPRSKYLERAKWLAPANPGLWYACGLQEVADGDLDRAWQSWLEL